MPSKLPQVNIRIGPDRLKEVKNLYRAANLKLEKGNREPYKSFNEFLNDIIIKYRYSEEGRLLYKIYRDNFYAEDKYEQDACIRKIKERIKNGPSEDW